MNFRLLIFDLDGTLVDSAEDVHFCLNQTRAKLGLPPLSLEQVRASIGPGPYKFAEIVIPKDRQDLFDEFIRLFRQCYMAHLTDRTRPFHGVRDTLKRMRDIDLILAVATNKPRRFTVKLLKDLNLLDYFAYILTPEDVPHRKPAPDIILKALEMTGTPASETLFIGDTDNDILSGKAAGVWTCGVTYGYGPVELLKKLKPDFLVDRPDGILEIAASSRKERIPEVE